MWLGGLGGGRVISDDKVWSVNVVTGSCVPRGWQNSLSPFFSHVVFTGDISIIFPFKMYIIFVPSFYVLLCFPPIPSLLSLPSPL